MSDPLSIAGSAARSIPLAIQVTQSLIGFYNSCKHQDTEIAVTTERLESLLSILKFFTKTLSNCKFQVDEQRLIDRIKTSIGDCDKLIQQLQEECRKFTQATSSGIQAGFRDSGRQATYPFQESPLHGLDDDIGQLFDNLSIAVHALQLEDNQRLLLDLGKTFLTPRAISTCINRWREAPDATVNHDAVVAKKYPGTGMWFVKSSKFTVWLTQDNSFLWLNGFAGSGKSVLASTAIQFVFRHRRSNPRIGIAFFYFIFNDESKQDVLAMLQALLMQLLGQLHDGYLHFTRLQDLSPSGTLSLSLLTNYLRRLIQEFDHVYVVVDALDESSRLGARGQVLDTIERIQTWSLPGLHLLVTSRDEPDIRISLNFSSDQEVKMRNDGIDKDIADFISSRLQEDQNLRKWLPHSDRIRETLAKRAQGVFRWVECQLKSLESFPQSEDHLDCLLKSLPQSLDETYERMLCNIDKSRIEDCRRILALLCFSTRPLTVPELIEGVAIDVNTAQLKLKRRLQNADEIHDICLGLVDIGLSTNDMTDLDKPTQTVRIAHFSVREYLESERIRKQKAAIFGLTAASANVEIAQILLIYLLAPGLAITNSDEYPLAHFAARFWYHHYKSAENLGFKLHSLVLKLFLLPNKVLRPLLRLLKDDFGNHAFSTARNTMDYASLLGLRWVIEELLSTKNNAHGRKYANALNAASSQGHKEVVKLLVEKDVDVNIAAGYHGHALYAASYGDHQEVIKLLVEIGADVNAQGGEYGNALQAASSQGHEDVVNLLIERGADVNATCGEYGIPLQAASYGGHKKVVQLLVEKGADVNVEGGKYGNALQAASRGGHQEIAHLLVEKGADVNAQGGQYGNALQAASSQGHKDIFQLLVNNCADVNAEGGEYGNALQAASRGGHQEVVQLLVEKGADVNAQGGQYGNALQAASRGGHQEAVQLLVEKGADVNAQGGEYGNALQAASYRGRQKVVELLVEKGANVNAQGGEYGNALQAASFQGHEDMVRLLIEQGADVNAKGGEYGNALQAASYGGHNEVVKLLVKNGADVNAQGGEYNNALQVASYRGKEEVVKFLVKSGADVNAQGGGDGNALYAASYAGEKEVVQLLLEKGAEVNAEGGGLGNALKTAIYGGHNEVVQLLLQKGADVNAEGGDCGTALQVASYWGFKEMVQLLIEKGADVNAKGGRNGNALQAAWHGGCSEVIQLLVEQGADAAA